MSCFILIGNTSRYLCFKDAERVPSEITPHETVRTPPRSPGVPILHHQMKVSL
jgi:hypothetical protein